MEVQVEVVYYSDLGAAESKAKVKGNYAFILTGNHEAILLTKEFV